MDDNMKYLIQGMANTQSQLSEMKTLLTSNQTRISQLEDQVCGLNGEVKQLKELVNLREQQARNLTVRILGLPVTEDEVNGPDPAASTARTAYERIVRPILSVAKTKGKISTLPALQNTVIKAYRTSKPSPANPPPPIILHLVSANVKTAIFSARKDALPNPTDAEKAAGLKKFLLVEDLTPPTFAFLKLMKEDKRVERAWTVDGQIKFIKAGDKENVIHKVRSIYNTIDSLFTK
jgi:chromosome segregation ATPase